MHRQTEDQGLESSSGIVPAVGVVSESMAQHYAVCAGRGLVFPSLRMPGKIPMCAGIFVTDHLRPAALAAGIQIGDGQRFGLHSLRSSMATGMVSIDKTDVKTAQGNMRHAGPEIMLRKYAQVVTPEMQGVQVRWFESCGLGVGQNLLAENAGRNAIQ
jgi:integrase